MRTYTVIFLGILAAAVIAGCAGPDYNYTQPNRTEYLPPEGVPSIDILSPQDDEEINGTSVGVFVNVTNFRLAAIVSNPSNVKNEGHIHFFLDDEEKMSPLQSISFSGAEPGEHVVRVELRNNDHSKFSGFASDSVRIRVSRGNRTISTVP